MAITYSSSTINIVGSKETGTASSGTSTTLVDSSKSWTTDDYKDRMVLITGGTGEGQRRDIKSNDSTTLTVKIPFDTTPDNTSTYAISYSFDDVQAANDAGSWGVMTTNANQHLITCKVVVGDGSTVTLLKDVKKAIEYQYSEFFTRLKSKMQWGELDSGGYAQYGCYFNAPSWTNITQNFGAYDRNSGDVGDFYSYGTLFNAGSFWAWYTLASYIGNEVELIDCSGNVAGRLQGANSIVKRCNFYHDTYYLTFKDFGGEISNLTVKGKAAYSLYYFESFTGNLTMRNSYLRLAPTSSIYMRCNGGGHTLTLVDCDADEWTMTWVSTGTLLRKYTFNPKIVNHRGVPLSNVQLSLYNADRDLLFALNTQSNGMLSEVQDVLYATYTQAGGDTPVLEGDFSLLIARAGYEQQHIHGIPMDEPFNSVIELEPLLCNSQHTSVKVQIDR